MAGRNKAYAVMWLTGTDAESLMTNTLVYRGSDKGVRTYKVGHLDPRAGDEDEMPRFEGAFDAMEWMVAHLGEKCLVEVSAAKLIRQDTYATPV